MLSFVTLVCVLGGCACAGSSANLRPTEINDDHGALFGQITVVSEALDVTQNCRALLAVGEDYWQTEVLLGSTGWVFTTIERGSVTLVGVDCSAGHTKLDLRFDVPGNGRIAYFGHVRVDLGFKDEAPSNRKQMTAVAIGAVLGGGLGAAIAAAAVPPEKRVGIQAAGPVFHVDNRYAEAVTYYQERYGKQSSALKPVVSIAGHPGTIAEQSRGEHPPTSAAGFTLGQPVAAAEARCTGAGLMWQKTEAGVFWCSGAPLDLGVPATVQVTVCAETVCEVAVNASSDGAVWSTLVQRFGRLSKLLVGSHSDPQSHEKKSLDDCAGDPRSCFAKGRGRASASWSWPGRQSLALVLHGGPPGGAPSLTVVYRVLSTQR